MIFFGRFSVNDNFLRSYLNLSWFAPIYSTLLFFSFSNQQKTIYIWKPSIPWVTVTALESPKYEINFLNAASKKYSHNKIKI